MKPERKGQCKTMSCKGEPRAMTVRTITENGTVSKEEPGRTDRALTDDPNGRVPAWVRELKYRQKRGTGVKIEPPPLNSRRVWVLFNTEAGDGYARHVDYSVKDFARGADKDDPSFVKGHPFFSENSEAISAARVKNVCMTDPFMHRLMINPYDGYRIMSREFVRAYMAILERTIGVRLFWVAAIHAKDTTVRVGNRHAHIIIRGKTVGREPVTFTRQFRREGFRWLAIKLATERLGPMTPEEIEEAERLSNEAGRRATARMLAIAGAPDWAIRNITEVSSE